MWIKNKSKYFALKNEKFLTQEGTRKKKTLTFATWYRREFTTKLAFYKPFHFIKIWHYGFLGIRFAFPQECKLGHFQFL